MTTLWQVYEYIAGHPAPITPPLPRVLALARHEGLEQSQEQAEHPCSFTVRAVDNGDGPAID